MGFLLIIVTLKLYDDNKSSESIILEYHVVQGIYLPPNSNCPKSQTDSDAYTSGREGSITHNAWNEKFM